MLPLPLALVSWLVGPPIQRPGEQAPLELEWRAPDECPSGRVVIERLHDRMPGSSRSTLRVHADVDASEAGFEVELRLTNAEGESTRRFAASDCDLLVDAIVLVIAVTIDPVG